MRFCGTCVFSCNTRCLTSHTNSVIYPRCAPGTSINPSGMDEFATMRAKERPVQDRPDVPFQVIRIRRRSKWCWRASMRNTRQRATRSCGRRCTGEREGASNERPRCLLDAERGVDGPKVEAIGECSVGVVTCEPRIMSAMLKGLIEVKTGEALSSLRAIGSTTVSCAGKETLEL